MEGSQHITNMVLEALPTLLLPQLWSAGGATALMAESRHP